VTIRPTLRDNARRVKTDLPIAEVLPALRAQLAQHRRLVIEAPPGAGKSTVVPLVLLEEPWAANKRILMLEPRRLATRAVATRMATSLGEPLGRTVGFRMRLETRVSAATRIEVITEGVFTRMLQHDPALEGVAAVLFDEFHERSLAADAGLALALDSQQHLRPDLRLIVMSATLDGVAVAKLLGDAPIVSARGRVFAVDVQYLGSNLPLLPGGADSPELAVLRGVQRALREGQGDVLVFLPGAGEIRRVQGMLQDLATSSNVDVRPLFGELAAGDQDAALLASPVGRRKVMLATNIAETSLTIAGVTAVVDSGIERRSVFDPASGMSRLETQRISRASAEQRAGRAGRTAAGVCYRLWSEGAHRSLAAYAQPEIAVADLAPLALDLAAWGTAAAQLRWLDPPPAATLASSSDLLLRLGALDGDGRITAHGRAMQTVATHPRLAHMLLEGERLDALPLAATLAALLSERDLIRVRGGPDHLRDSDIRTRVEALRRGESPAGGVDRGALERVRRAEQAFVRQLQSTPSERHRSVPNDAVSFGVLLAFAYPDRVGRRRTGADGRYQLSNGRGAVFGGPESIAREEFIVAVEVDDREREARILLAAPISKVDIEEYFKGRLQQRDQVVWDPREAAVQARRVVALDVLVIDERSLRAVPAELSAAAMLVGLQQLGLAALPWDDAARDWQARCAFMRSIARSDQSDWPDLSDAALSADLSWLSPFLEGITRRSHLTRVPLLDALRAQLSYAQLRQLEELAPSHVMLPTGTQVRIDYRDDNAPCASMRMQEVFGLAATPRIGGGTVPITFKLMSPAHRPLQVTRDLASFWRNAYIDVRKDMRGRYPRHYWPENPLEAEPTRRAKSKPRS
jgi:ATP-dependent helicase HrpB